MKWVSLAGLVLASCNPPPRDAAWFAANPAIAERVAHACAGGDRRSECENARAGMSRAKARARQERYRRGFD